MALLLINTIQPDREFVSDIVDDSIFPANIRAFFESKPNGCHITWSGSDMEWIEETEFDICDYTDESKLPPEMFGDKAKIDKIINIDY